MASELIITESVCMDDSAYPRELVEEAERHPGGWVYEIDETLVDGDAYSAAVPPEAIRGAWTVDGTWSVDG